MSDANSASAPATSRRLLWFCLGVTALAGLLHVLNLFFAGALWRDEAGGVGLATVPSFSELWRMLARDSFPAFFPVLLRLAAALGLASGDFGLRVLGGVIGLAIIAALWRNARLVSGGLPLLSLLLFALNFGVIRWGDSLRAYGCGTVFIILTFGWVWAFLRAPSMGRFVLASLGGVLSVQCLYQNAFLLLALLLAAALVCWQRGAARSAWLALAIGFPAALSLLPYAPLIRESQRWWILEQTGFRPGLVGGTLWEAVSSPPVLGAIGWGALFWLAAVRCVRFFETHAGGRSPRRALADADLAAFGAVTALAAPLCFGVFVATSGLPTQSWYWLSLLGLLATSFDSLGLPVSRLPSRAAWSAAVAFVGLSAVGALPFLSRPTTNVDRIATQLQTDASASDLVLVYPWYCGVSFHRYYHGSAPWLTVPDLADHRFHRYDLLKEQLRSPAPLQRVQEQVRATLAAGHSVWVVGGLPSAPPSGNPPAALPPAPDGPAGWYDEPYNAAWGVQLAYDLQQQAREVTVTPVAAARCLDRYECLVLTRARGFRGAAFPGVGDSVPR